MLTSLTHRELKTKQRGARAGFPETMGLRVHRSISWIGRAEQAEDSDARFILLWIAFNAAYADEQKVGHSPSGNRGGQNERSIFADYFEKVVALDSDKRIYGAIWKNFSGPVRLLMANKFVYSPFWQHHNGATGFENWESWFDKSRHGFNSAFASQKTSRVLAEVFDRLYVLRNQLLHGGATWDSQVNRRQVNDGAAILGFLVPIFVDLMMDNPDGDWGMPFYPVVE